MDALYLVPRELSDFLFHAHSLSHSNTATLPSLVLLNTPSTPPSGLLALSLSFPWILFSKLSTQLTLLPFSDLDSNDTLLIRYSLISRSKMQLLTFLALVSPYYSPQHLLISNTYNMQHAQHLLISSIYNMQHTQHLLISNIYNMQHAINLSISSTHQNTRKEIFFLFCSLLNQNVLKIIKKRIIERQKCIVLEVRLESIEILGSDSIWQPLVDKGSVFP